MKQLILCCLVWLCYHNLCAQTLDSIRHKYTKYNSLEVQEKVYVHTDRAWYAPDEDIWINAFIVNAENCPSTRSEQLYAVLYQPDGSIFKELTLQNSNGCAEGHIKLGADILGGIYKLRVYSYWMQNFEEEAYFEKELMVQKVVLPEVLMKLDFEREAYGAGDKVIAQFEARTKENEVLANTTLSYTVQLGGALLCTETTVTDKDGVALLVYELPQKLTTTNNLINIQLQQDGLTESIARSAPIVLNNLNVQILPEGGNVSANQVNRIAFKVLNEFGKPADVSGEVVNNGGKVIQRFETFHQGMGTFELTPKKGEHYKIRITKPIGIRKTWDVPAIDFDKVGFYLKEQTEKTIKFNLYSSKQQDLFLIAQQHGKLIHTKKVMANEAVTTVELATDKFPMGILQLTVFDVEKRVHAERLIFVNKERKLNVNFKTNKKSYAPREEVKLEVVVKDETGKGVQGNFSLAVVDDKQHTFADDKQDNILSYLLMSSELKGKINEPNFYFDPKEAKASKALDYVLLTHGWRRFEWAEVLEGMPRQNLPYPIQSKEIAGYLKIGSQLAKNQTIFLSQGQARYTKKKAVATVQTDKNGFFKFEDINLPLPLYVCANYHGEYHATCIQEYSKSGVNAEDVIPIYYRNEVSEKGYYKNKDDQKLYDRNNQRIEVIDGDIVDANGQKVTDGKNMCVVNGRIYQRGGGLVYLDEAGHPHTKKGLLSKRSINNRDQLLVDEAEKKYKEVVSNDSSKPADIAKARAKLSKAKAMQQTSLALDGYLVRNEQGKIVESLRYNLSLQDLKQVVERERKPMSDKALARVLMPAEDIVVSVNEYGGVNHNYTSNRYNVNSTLTGDLEIVENLKIEQIAPKKIYYSMVQKFYEPYYVDQQNPAERTDFRKTIYWNPKVQTDKNGRASVLYYNSDEITTFRAILEGNTRNGHLIHEEHTYHTIVPFSIVSKLPTALSFGDTVKIPVVLKNNTKNELTGSFSIQTPTFLKALTAPPTELTIPANDHKVVYLAYLVKFEDGQGVFRMAFTANKLKDAVETIMSTTSKGFPIDFAMSGQQLEQTDTVVVEGAYKGSFNSKLTIYSSVLDGLMDGVESILNIPSGCFEQVSSSNYPNILALQMMEKTGQMRGDIRKKALNYLKSGYAQLAAYEIKGGGFDWYGQAPAHEGLTAYGLVQFKDMQAVYDGVDPVMIERTKAYLLSRRDGQGGFLQNVGKYGFSGNKKGLFNAYITWALSELNTPNIQKEVEKMTKEAIRSEDLYRMSLAALTHFNQGNTQRAEALLETIQEIILKTGLDKIQAESTVTYSYGNALNIETLSFAALAMMKSDKRDEVLLVKIVQYLLSKRQYGRFGSTQSTIMALKALSAYANVVNKKKEDQMVNVFINNNKVVSLFYKKEQKGSLVFENLHEHFVEGQNIITIKFDEATRGLSYAFDVSWTAEKPQSHVRCPVVLTTILTDQQTTVGETIRLNVNLENVEETAIPSTIALIGIPAGLSVQTWQLKELQEKQVFAFYELKDNYLILYYRALEGKEQKQISLDLKTDVPGSYTAPASTAYLYYGDEYKYWTEGTAVKLENAPTTK